MAANPVITVTKPAATLQKKLILGDSLDGFQHVVLQCQVGTARTHLKHSMQQWNYSLKPVS